MGLESTAVKHVRQISRRKLIIKVRDTIRNALKHTPTANNIYIVYGGDSEPNIYAIDTPIIVVPIVLIPTINHRITGLCHTSLIILLYISFSAVFNGRPSHSSIVRAHVFTERQTSILSKVIQGWH